jgi:rRNA biogenesis protein RRP5
MCRLSELSDDFVDHPAKYYKEGDAVKALVIKIDPERQRFEVSLKPSHFEGDIDSSDEETAKPKKQRKSKKAKKQLDDSADSMLQDSDDEDEENLLVVSKSDSEAEEDDEEEEEEEDGDEMKVEGLAPVGFDWGDATPTKAEPIESKKRKRSAKAADDDEAKENEEEIELEEKKGKKKRAKKAQQAAEEEELAAKEDELLAEALPKTADDYEKLLLASPNSSFLWIKYMAFQVHFDHNRATSSLRGASV